MADADINIFGMLIFVMLLGAIPFAAVSVSAFTKIAVVMFILRNALGIQQTPPNMVLYAIAIILSVYIAKPVIDETITRIEAEDLSYETLSDYQSALQLGSQPIKDFLVKNTDPDKRGFFTNATEKIWKLEDHSYAKPEADDMAILVPSFLVSELTKAFQIGFLIYLPFLAIDIVITVILMALGMMMVSPTVISVPFKLLLFVFLEGWTQLIQGLVLSYGG